MRAYFYLITDWVLVCLVYERLNLSFFCIVRFSLFYRYQIVCLAVDLMHISVHLALAGYVHLDVLDVCVCIALDRVIFLWC